MNSVRITRAIRPFQAISRQDAVKCAGTDEVRNSDGGDHGHANLTQSAYEIIKKRILTGVLLPGTSLSTAKVASTLRMGQMPVRSALARLQVEGWVNIVPKRGVLVAELSAKELQENAFVRSRLEGLAAYLACGNKRQRAVVALRKCVATMHAAVAWGDSEAWFNANGRFHEIIARASGNAVLMRLIRDLRYHGLRGRFVTGHIPGHADRQNAQHEELVTALAEGDKDSAERIMRDHILVGGAEVADYVRKVRRRKSPRQGATESSEGSLLSKRTRTSSYR
jgi:GntR family transcriptional regulator, rspAB operon transcriptional repressor